MWWKIPPREDDPADPASKEVEDSRMQFPALFLFFFFLVEGVKSTNLKDLNNRHSGLPFVLLIILYFMKLWAVPSCDTLYSSSQNPSFFISRNISSIKSEATAGPLLSGVFDSAFSNHLKKHDYFSFFNTKLFVFLSPLEPPSGSSSTPR